MRPLSLLLVDNYDSYTHNLLALVRETFVIKHFTVLRNTDPRVLQLSADLLVLSAGPMTPSKSGYGASKQLLRNYQNKIVIGVCLGFQIISEWFGGRLLRSKRPLHGVSELVHHRADVVFKAIPSPFPAMRYNSLTVSGLPASLLVNAASSAGEPMSLRHTDPNRRLYGFQFHPESFATPHGKQLFKNLAASVIG